MTNKFKVWLQGLAAAALSGAAGGATQMISTTGHVTVATGAAAGVTALIGVLGYLLKSPLQAVEDPAPAPTSANSTAAK